METALHRWLPSPVRWVRPTGGYLLWLQLPQSVKAMELHALASARRYQHHSGEFFSDARVPGLYPAQFRPSLGQSLRKRDSRTRRNSRRPFYSRLVSPPQRQRSSLRREALCGALPYPIRAHERACNQNPCAELVTSAIRCTAPKMSKPIIEASATAANRQQHHVDIRHIRLISGTFAYPKKAGQHHANHTEKFHDFSPRNPSHGKYSRPSAGSGRAVIADSR